MLIVGVKNITKECSSCGELYQANSARQKYCFNCRGKLLICQECGGQNKNHFHKFCSRSCASKYVARVFKNGESSRLKTNWVGVKKCKSCESNFLAASGSRRFCDKCTAEKSVCPECSKPKSIYDSFCSNSCAGKWKFRNSEKVREVIRLGKLHPNRAIGLGNALRGKPKIHLRGDKNPNWKGGTYGTERHTDMSRVEYANWRRAVYERDKYTCKHCGKHGGKLNADHILPYKFFPELKFTVTNGRTLCHECHRKTPSWGSGLYGIKREEFLIF